MVDREDSHDYNLYNLCNPVVMNPLQEYPHLFANGNFLIKITCHDSHMYFLDTHMYFLDKGELGTIIGKTGKRVLVDFESSGWKDIEPDDCTLIARPISDMTGEELKYVFGFDINTDKERLIKDLSIKAEMGTIPSNQLLRILSIGVYAFDQSHFDDGTVIDSREV